MSSTFTTNRSRISVKPNCPNPLFEKWLEEWRNEAAEKNSDVQYCYAKALESLRKYPITLKSGKECLILKNFGTKLCLKLDQKLTEYKNNHSEEFVDHGMGSHDFIQPQTKWVVPSVPSIFNNKKTNKRKKGTLTEDSNVSKTQSSPRTKKKPYFPTLRSGTYAILITLLNEQTHPLYRGYMLKSEIQEKAQYYCDSSFTRPDPGSYYTAWSSMSSAIKKGLVSKTGNPAKFSLTKNGKDLAEKMLLNFETREGTSTFRNDYFTTDLNSKIDSSLDETRSLSPLKYKTFSSSNIQEGSTVKSDSATLSSSSHVHISHDSNDSSNSTPHKNFVDFYNVDLTEFNDESKQIPLMLTSPIKMKVGSSSDDLTSNCNDFEQLILMPGDFQIILLVDTQETQGKIKEPMSDETIRELTNLKTNFDVRHLEVGDFVWVARNGCGKELLLPYIVERKRMDDLGKSIKDGRFHEQKFRLRQCGLQNVIYLVEKYGNDTRLGLPVNTLQQAIMNTQVVDNFFVKITNNHRQSMVYLSVLTNLLSNIFKDKTLISCIRKDLPPFKIDADLISLQTFQEFSKFSAKNKNLKIQEVFIKHLLQLKGLSVEKAVAIVEKYSTPRNLCRALDSCEKPELLLSTITYGALNRNIGPSISKAVSQLYINRYLE